MLYWMREVLPVLVNYSQIAVATLMIDYCTLTCVCLDEHLIISSNGCEIKSSSRLHKQSIMQIKSVVLSYETVAKMPNITGKEYQL